MTEMPKERKTAVKSTETVKKVRSVVRTMYSRAHQAKEQGIPVAYCMAGCAYNEILDAMGIVPIWTENYAGLCSAKQDSERFILKAEAEGYSNLICSYARTGIGFDALRSELHGTPPGSPDGGMAEPDMLLGCSFACDPRFKWYQALGRYKNTPIYAMDVVIPSVDADMNEVREYYVKYQTEQFKGLVDFLEKQTKKKLDYDKLSDVIDTTDETYRIWWECYQLRKAIPCPMPSEDHFNAFVPGLFEAGKKETVDFYRELYTEIEQRVQNKTGVIDEEKYRLLWAGGLPPWHNMWIFNYFESHGAVFVIETMYKPPDPAKIPVIVTNPLERLAWRSILRWTEKHEKARQRSHNPEVEMILDMVDDYKIDGMVTHASKSCRASSMGQMFFMDLVKTYVKVPSLQLTSDLVDAREYSQTQWLIQIGTFLETVNSAKRGKNL
jgi:benzoyl-CoA reductase/2-hydroxyglutaryl-CoA dehydratase subunit BcrC/BadD/HgdB